jgi:hypothetical protein
VQSPAWELFSPLGEEMVVVLLVSNLAALALLAIEKKRTERLYGVISDMISVREAKWIR